jgi:predicted transcriptional regulator
LAPAVSELHLRRIPMRGRIDIIANILHEACKGAKKTRIMYRCNLSFRQMKVYLNFLLERELLEVRSIIQENSKAEVYVVTKEGKEFLKNYNKLKEILRKKGSDL